MSGKKKIILTGSTPPPYHGSNVYFFNLINSEIKDDFEIHHLDTSDHRNLDNITKLDFTNVYLALKNIFQMIKLLGKVKPDIVYVPPPSHFLPYLRDGLFIFSASFFSRAKIIIHFHGGKYFRDEFYDKSNIFVKTFVKRSLQKVDLAIVLSDKLKPVFEGLVKNISAIPNGTDFGISFAKEDYEKKDKAIVKISYLGNLFESKGVIDILNSIRNVIAKNKNTEFEFAGAWSENEKDTKKICMQIIKENNLDKYVKFHGLVLGETKEKFLLDTDIFVFPSHNEGLPFVILEAMSAGCPVISTKDVGAIPDIVVDGVTGILVEKKKPEQVSGAILKLIEDKDLRMKMGTAGRERFEKYFTLEKNIEAIDKMFRGF